MLSFGVARALSGRGTARVGEAAKLDDGRQPRAVRREPHDPETLFARLPARLERSGLDPAEVFETLPEVLQNAFGERDVEALKGALATLSPEDAQHHMQRCIDSGLWDPAGAGGDAVEAD